MLYLVGECKIHFLVATRIPSFGKNSWIYLLDSIIMVDVKHRQPIHAIFSQCCPMPSLQAPELRKTANMHRNRLVMLEVTLKSHENVGTSQLQHRKLGL